MGRVCHLFIEGVREIYLEYCFGDTEKYILLNLDDLRRNLSHRGDTFIYPHML